MCVNQGTSLKDEAYEIIKESVENYEEFIEAEREEARKKGIKFDPHDFRKFRPT